VNTKEWKRMNLRTKRFLNLVLVFIMIFTWSTSVLGAPPCWGASSLAEVTAKKSIFGLLKTVVEVLDEIPAIIDDIGSIFKPDEPEGQSPIEPEYEEPQNHGTKKEYEQWEGYNSLTEVGQVKEGHGAGVKIPEPEHHTNEFGSDWG
jgi:hypothetical protein